MKANQLFKTLALGALLLSPLAQAKLDVMAHEPYTRAMAPGATTSAVFATFANRSKTTSISLPQKRQQRAKSNYTMSLKMAM